MSEPDAKVIAGALGDSDRRRMLAAIELGAETLPDAAKASGLPDQRAAKALARLLASRVVVGDADGGVRVDDDAFRRAARTARARPPSDEHAGQPEQRRKVLDAIVR